MNRNELREALAAYAHEAWKVSKRYLLQQCARARDAAPDNPLAVALAERWEELMNTPYSDLSAPAKDADRLEADKILAILDGYLQSSMSKEEKRMAVEKHLIAEVDKTLAIFDEYLQPPPTPGEERCSWKNIEHEVSGWDYWETGCGEGFCLADGTPQTYNMCFCPFCGCRIAQLGEGVESEPEQGGKEGKT